MASSLVIDLTNVAEAQQAARPRSRKRVREEVIDLVARQEEGSQSSTQQAPAAAAAAMVAVGEVEQPRRKRRERAVAIDLTNSQDDNLLACSRSPAAKRYGGKAVEAPSDEWHSAALPAPRHHEVQQSQRQQTQPEQPIRRGQWLKGKEQTQAEQGPCSICIEDEGPFMHSFAACKHHFCLPCLREYISGKVVDRVFPVPCPLPDSKAPISADECGLVLTPEEQATMGKVKEWQSDGGGRSDGGGGARLFCSNPKRSQLLIADDKRTDTAMDCPYCQQQLCANCGVAWHQGLTCQQYQALPGAVRSKEDQALLDMAEKDGLKRCPGCGQLVEGTQGCSHVHCRCGAVFCYSCGRSKSKGSSHYCTCRPAAEQWLPPPAVMAQQVQEQAVAQEAQRAAQRQANHQRQQQQQGDQPRRGRATHGAGAAGAPGRRAATAAVAPEWARAGLPNCAGLLGLGALTQQMLWSVG